MYAVSVPSGQESLGGPTAMNKGMRRWPMASFVASIALAGLLIAGSTAFVMGRRAARRAADLELQQQQSERRECEERLSLFHRAWLQYRVAHHGVEPPSLEALIPDYIPNGRLLECPTAERWERQAAQLDHGTITVRRRNYPVTYGFLWLTASGPHAVKTKGDRAPLVVCTAHEEGLFRAAYGHAPPLGAFSPERRLNWIPAVRDSRALNVLRNGTVAEVAPADDQ